MWVFQTDSFLSVVAHREKPGVLLVRSRIAGDIERVFPDAAVWEDTAADYRFRAEVDAERFKAALGEAVDRITYDNFKAAVPDGARHDAYLRVWQVMASCYASLP